MVGREGKAHSDKPQDLQVRELVTVGHVDEILVNFSTPPFLPTSHRPALPWPIPGTVHARSVGNGPSSAGDCASRIMHSGESWVEPNMNILSPVSYHHH
ncbi:unnamed protein product [Parascedosporium putredinis]|uniref:Uncharacterized protein n=1 Tax=Parascedosporium putredinis TaxID=1442378 RepID=A0A9P1H5L5_9PEZI|nr:unnamed protein product [Parascedosporium putredinis]CAI7998059.1 unnamed protein product [Parascedosporium putredinis]